MTEQYLVVFLPTYNKMPRAMVGRKIQIAAGSLIVADNAELDVGTFGQGNGGSVIVNVRDGISFDNGNIFSNVDEGATGQGGNIQISARSISFTNSAEIQVSTGGLGNAGNVIITADDAVFFDGVSLSVFESGIFPSGIFSEVEETGQGKGGDIHIIAGSLSLMALK
ncbi:hypothetical protein [Scytonema sp. NUACC26]|uniref:hypothetical protein n=1 Tax=Scytonema sp. NUACC26 TaxID=3140176 RepID=UPI0034DC5621